MVKSSELFSQKSSIKITGDWKQAELRVISDCQKIPVFCLVIFFRVSTTNKTYCLQKRTIVLIFQKKFNLTKIFNWTNKKIF